MGPVSHSRLTGANRVVDRCLKILPCPGRGFGRPHTNVYLDLRSWGMAGAYGASRFAICVTAREAVNSAFGQHVVGIGYVRVRESSSLLVARGRALPTYS